MFDVALETQTVTELGQSARILGLNPNALSLPGPGLLLKYCFIT